MSQSDSSKWKPDLEIFQEWVKDKAEYLKHGLTAEPTIKVLIFLALLEVDKPCTYAEIKKIFNNKKIISGQIPDNTLRTSVLNLSKTLDKFQHTLELKSERGKFTLVQRRDRYLLPSDIKNNDVNQIVFLTPTMAVKPEQIAQELIEKARMPFHALYFLEWSARWWEIFSHSETQIRVQYEVDSLEKLGVQERMLSNPSNVISIVGLAVGEGLAEIQIIKKLLSENPEKTIHYLAIDLSQRLLRQHLNLLNESLFSNIQDNRLICAGISADIFNNFSNTITFIKTEVFNKGLVSNPDAFLPSKSSLLVTYLGNCLGNHYDAQENEIFSIINSIFENRPIEFLVGVSVMRPTTDKYKRNWDNFLLQTPKHLMESKNLLISSRPEDSGSLPEFSLPENGDNKNRCPVVIPEHYLSQHGISGQIYRFYYKLEFELKLKLNNYQNIKNLCLPKGSLILLYNIIKYEMVSLVHGIEACGLFKVAYDDNYHKIIDTPNGIREYAVFSAHNI